MKTLKTLLILAITTTTAMAQNTLPPPTIDVTGEGIVRVVPDEYGRKHQDAKRAKRCDD